MNQPEQWHDLCRKRINTIKDAEKEMPQALAVLTKTAQAILNRKLFQGYEALEPMKRERVWLVKVVESIKSPVTGAGTGAVFLEVYHTCSIRKLS